MIDTDGVHEIANTGNPLRRGDVVFVHGLNGSSHRTWRHLSPDSVDHFFWPAALAEDLPEYGVWTVGYAAGIHTLGRPGMIIGRRAGNLAHQMVNAGLGSHPIIFITHSMGGLVIKSLVATSQFQGDPDRTTIAAATEGIVFCATPHRGSAFAEAASLLGKYLGGIQPHVEELRADSKELDILHAEFVKWQRRRRVPLLNYAESLSLTHWNVFSRTVPLPLVVTRISADPGIYGYPVYDVDEDHLTIAKPKNRQSAVYGGVLRFARAPNQTNADATYHPAQSIDVVVPSSLPGVETYEQLPWFLRNRLAEFNMLYRSTEHSLVPFGGRQECTDALLGWATDTDRCARCLVTGPAGRGKSALMSQVAEALDTSASNADATGWQVLLVPISMRFQTHTPDIYLQILATCLAHLAGIALPTAVREPLQPQALLYYESACLAAIDQIIKSGRKVLIIVDGIDEALSGRFSASWFPSQTNGRVKLLLSARAQLGQEDAGGWIAQLGWWGGYEQLSLPAFDEANVVDVLRNAGAAPCDLAPGQPLAARLLYLTAGEPFLLAMYIRDLWPEGGHGAPVSMAQLDTRKPGFADYFSSWMTQQKDAWELERQQGAALNYESIRAHLTTLACAKGRLPARELLSVVARAHGIASDFSIESPLWPIRRFVVGVNRARGSVAESYVLSHPKLAEFFLGYFPPESIDRTHQAFVALGMELIAALNHGLQRAEEASPYFVEFYAHHLRDAQVPADTYDILLSSGWSAAHAALGGNLVGFIRDARIAASAVIEQRPAAWRSRLLAHHLFVSSARTATVLPGRLMMAGIAHGFVRPDAALRMLELVGDDAKWFGLLKLLPHLDEIQKAPVIGDALLSAQRLEPGSERAIALASLLPFVTKAQRDSVREDLFSQFDHTGNMARFLATVERVAPLVGDDGRRELRGLLLKQIKDEGDWIYLLRLLPYMSRPELDESITKAAGRNIVLQKRLHADAAPNDEHSPGLEGDLLVVVFRFLPAHVQATQMATVLQIIRHSDDAYLKAVGLIGVIAASGPTSYELYKGELTHAIESQYFAYEQVLLKSELSKVLSSRHRDEEVASALTAVCKYIQSESLSRFENIAEVLTDAERDMALAAIATAPYRSAKAAALDDLAPYLNREQTAAAIAMLRYIGDEVICDLTLSALEGPQLSDGQQAALTQHEIGEVTEWLKHPRLDSRYEDLCSRLSRLESDKKLLAYEKLAVDAEWTDRTLVVHCLSTCARAIWEMEGDEGLQILRSRISAVRSTFP